MRNKLLILTIACACTATPSLAQRHAEHLNRGVVAMNKGSNKLYVSWRYLATDAPSTAFNVYFKQGAIVPITKLNNAPITASTNLEVDAHAKHSNASLDLGSVTVFVRPVNNGVESTTEVDSAVMNKEHYRIVREHSFAAMPDSALAKLPTGATYRMKFCWPADLNGDGQYDYVLDRQYYGDAVNETGSTDAGLWPSPYVEAYDHSGAFKWRICVGPNVKICDGHADMVVAYDMDGDGKAEVMMKTSEGTVFADGKVFVGSNGKVKDYRVTNEVAPQFISIINGETGAEIDRIEMTSSAEYYNKSDLSGEWHYKQMSGHFAIAYCDGIHPSLLFEQENRNANGSFNFMVTTWDYRNGKLRERWSWKDDLSDNTDYAHFHQIRIADVNGDGKDDMIEGAFALSGDGTPLFTTELVHGDRHHTTDFDPDRPGLETFAIQQDNASMLGMGYYDAGTGEMLKRWYMTSVGDVGRGTAADLDAGTRGVEMWSTMDGYQLYDCKGNTMTSEKGVFPVEPIWWNEDLGREVLSTADGNGRNYYIQEWNQSTKEFNRTVSLFREKADYYTSTYYAGRAAFYGDILGDWREELIVERQTTGFAVVSTWDVTQSRIYCLMQNPAYRMQATTKGYYQSPFTDYYLGYGMPAPPIAPIQKADVYYVSGDNFASASYVDGRDAAQPFDDGKSVMLDIRGAQTGISIGSGVAPSKLWVMNPKGKDYTLTNAASGGFTGAMELVKSMQGTLTMNGNQAYTGVTRISEGKLAVNGAMAGRVAIEARGILAGNATLSAGIDLGEGLNYLGGRIEPGNGCAADKLGTIIINGDVTGAGRNCFAFDVVPGSARVNDTLRIVGNFNVTGTNNTLDITFPDGKSVEGTYTLITFSGTTNATPASFTLRGVEYVPWEIIVEANAIKLHIDKSRSAGNVVWTGSTSSAWNFRDANFTIDGAATLFAPGDAVTFTDNAAHKAVAIAEQMPLASVTFALDTATYALSGAGGIGSSASLTQTGGTLKISTPNTYTGATRLLGGTTDVQDIANAGETSSLGAGSSIELRDVVLRITGANSSATNRSIAMSGRTTLDVAGGSTLIVTSAIAGDSASFVKTGNGLLNLQAASLFKSVTLQAGTTILGTTTSSSKGFGTAPVTLEGGTLRLLDINDMNSSFDFANNIVVPEGKSVRIEASSRSSMSGALTGSGTVEFAIPYTRFDLKGDWSQFEGTINAVYLKGGLTSSNTGDFRVNNTFGYGKATVNLGASVSFYSTTGGNSTSKYNIAIGALAGDATASISGVGTLTVGGNNANTEYKGSIASGIGLTKEGTGTFTLSSAALTLGNIAVNAGTLRVATATLNGSQLTVANGGTLRLAKGSVVSCSKLTLGGTLHVELDAAQRVVGARFTVLKGSITGTFAHIAPALPDGMAWDQSEIVRGIIKIAHAHTVRFADHGLIIDSVSVADGERVSEPAAPEHEGENFVGWYRDSALYDFMLPVNAAMTLDAKYDSIRCRVRYIVDGAVFATQNVTYGNRTAPPADIATEREGYRFVGWMHNDTLYDFAAPVRSNLMLVATWETVQSTGVLSSAYTLRLYPNPTTGQLTIDNCQLTIGEKVAIYSLSGTLVKTFAITDTSASLDVSSLADGTYIVRVGKMVGKMVKQ